MQRIKWGIIGCGAVTEMKSGPAFGKVGDSQVVAVMRRDGKKAEDYARRHHISRWYDRADLLIRDPDVNAVYVATPPSSHARYAVQAMEAGKAVYVEKPMAADYADCLLMNDTAKRTGMPLYVAYYRRYLPYFIKVREILQSQILGEIMLVQAILNLPPRQEDLDREHLPWRVDRQVAGGGYFYDLACHQIDLFAWFFGKIKTLSGISVNRAGLYEAEDVVLANWVYESGIPLNGSWCFVAEKETQQDTVVVYGTRATLAFSTFGFSPIRVTGSAGVKEELPPNPENIQYFFIRNMVEELQGKRPQIGNGREGAETNRIMDIILGKLKG